jgi:acetolactate synthase-1/2/3 large subunit
MIGSYGNRWANVSLAEADFILVLGSRLDIRQTGADTVGFKGDRQIFQVDCDPAEVNNRVTGCEEIIAPLGSFFEHISRQLPADPWTDSDGWLAHIEALRLRWPDTAELDGVAGINPNILVHQISKTFKESAAYVVDVGQHQMWAAQSVEISADQRFLTSGGMGSMGFALPAAIGTAFALSGKPVVLIAGDGGFQCNIQELQTVTRNKLNLKMIIFNNRCHGMVRQFQESYLQSRFQSTVWGYDPPDFMAVSEAYKIPARTVSDPAAVEGALRWLHEGGEEPRLLQVMIDPSANAYPKIAFGRPVSEMEPTATPIAMEST